MDAGGRGKAGRCPARACSLPPYDTPVTSYYPSIPSLRDLLVPSASQSSLPLILLLLLPVVVAAVPHLPLRLF